MKKKEPLIFSEIQHIQPVNTVEEMKAAILVGDLTKPRNATRLLQAKVNSIPQFAIGKFTWYIADRLTICNMGGMAEYFTGHPPAYWFNKSPEEYLQLVHPEDAPYLMSYAALIYAFLMNIPRAKKKYIRPHIYFRLFHPPTEQYKWILFQYIDWIYAPDGSIACILHLLNDITHLKDDMGHAKMTIVDCSSDEHQLFFSQAPQPNFGTALQQITVCRLSGREQEVLRLLAKGMSSKQIANQLQIAKNTVENHRQNLLKKTVSSTSAEVVAYALKNGLL